MRVSFEDKRVRDIQILEEGNLPEFEPPEEKEDAGDAEADSDAEANAEADADAGAEYGGRFGGGGNRRRRGV